MFFIHFFFGYFPLIFIIIITSLFYTFLVLFKENVKKIKKKRNSKKKEIKERFLKSHMKLPTQSGSLVAREFDSNIDFILNSIAIAPALTLFPISRKEKERKRSSIARGSRSIRRFRFIPKSESGIFLYF